MMLGKVLIPMPKVKIGSAYFEGCFDKFKKFIAFSKKFTDFCTIFAPR